jgi:hypothetical protein
MNVGRFFKLKKGILTTIIVACLLSACAKEEKTVADDVSVEEVNIDDESATLYDAFLQGSAKETVENSDDATGKNLFEKFLSNEESVIVESDRLWVWEISDAQPFANDKNYLFSELIHRVMMEDDLSVDIKYAYIVPKAKEPEQLLLSITTYEFEADPYNNVFVIRDVDGKLKLSYGNIDHFREEAHINKFGYIDEHYYPGYRPPTDIYRILTEDGCKLIYGTTFECGDIIKPAQLQSFSEDGGYIWNYWFEDKGFCSYSFVNEKGEPDYIGLEEKLYGKNSPYRKAFEDAGIKFYEMSEIEDMISKKEEELGITDEIKEANEPEWIEIKDISG